MPLDFASRVIRWQKRHGRHDLPWQGTRDAYRIWLSEIMLQQTQVAVVIPYFERFIARFPDVRALADADEDEVLALWSGLGYYARAHNLRRAAREVVDRHGGVFPARYEALVSLPGVGRSTASAIASFASGERRAILDGNVKRVLARHAGIAGDSAKAAVAARLWGEAEARLPRRDIEAYTQGLMDLGATVCGRSSPACDACPVATDCVARIEERIPDLPGRRERGAAKRRRVTMLVVISRGEVLLEKRPPMGVWGGLWSLPEVPTNGDAAQALARDWGIDAAQFDPLAPFEHAFTHFTLEVSPLLVRVRKPALAGESKPAMWLALDDLQGAALPSPVRKLLTRLAMQYEGQTPIFRAVVAKHRQSNNHRPKRKIGV